MSLVAQNIAREYANRSESLSEYPGSLHRSRPAPPTDPLLSSTVLDVKEQCKDLARAVISIGDRLGSVTSTLDVTKSNHDELEMRSTASMRAFEVKVDTIYRKIEAFETVVDNAYNKVISFETRMDTMIRKFETLETKIGKLDTDLDAIFTFVGDYREKTNAEIARLKGLPV